ncbi:MAG: efflux RND transporter periplasmic adaptor subunit, partial [Planctomycetota bacterium]
VKEGEILAELSVPEFDEDLIQKEALVAQAKAELERAKKLHAAAEANFKVAGAKVLEARAARLRATAESARAESTYDRLKKSASVLAEENIAEAKLSFEAARANVAEVESKVASAEASELESAAKRDTAFTDIDVAAARLRVAEASSRNMREILKYAKLTAPYAGVVVKRNIDLGHLVQASGGKSEPVFVVARMSPVRIFVDVPENDAGLIKEDEAEKTKVAIRVQAIKGEEFKGTVKRTSWALDPKSRILRTEIDLPNLEGKLRPGMYAFAIVSVVHKDVWAVPAAAIVTKNNKTFCHFVEDDKSRLVPILIGFRTPEFVEVIKKQSDAAEGMWRDFTGKEDIEIHQ